MDPFGLKIYVLNVGYTSGMDPMMGSMCLTKIPSSRQAFQQTKTQNGEQFSPPHDVMAPGRRKNYCSRPWNEASESKHLKIDGWNTIVSFWGV